MCIYVIARVLFISFVAVTLTLIYLKENQTDSHLMFIVHFYMSVLLFIHYLCSPWKLFLFRHHIFFSVNPAVFPSFANDLSFFVQVIRKISCKDCYAWQKKIMLITLALQVNLMQFGLVHESLRKVLFSECYVLSVCLRTCGLIRLGVALEGRRKDTSGRLRNSKKKRIKTDWAFVNLC